MTEFVALDGEGLTRSDGTHDYTLFAASDGSYIENYDVGGLSTVECFDYLLEVGAGNPGAILVGFYTNYDVNMILRDVPEKVLEGLWMGEIRTWRADEHGYRQYRLECVPNRVLKLSKGFWYVEEKTARSKWYTEQSVTWWDCSQFFQSSFVKALREWKAAPVEVIEEIERMKNKRGEFNPDEIEQIRAYCQKECELLVGIMDRVATALDALELRLSSWYGAGSIASALLRREGGKKHVVAEWEIPELERSVMGAYFGGRVETFGIGVIDTETYNYDVRSAYPSAIANMPSMTEGEWSYSPDYDGAQRWAVWHVKWSRIRPEEVRLTPFPFRHDKRIYWPYEGEGYYHASEVAAALKVFGDGSRNILVEVIDGWVYHESGSRPFAWTRELYEARAEYKRAGQPQEKILKLGINSEYGKFAQSKGSKPNQRPPYQCYFLAGAITADCRAKLLLAASKVPTDDLLAIATDGLFTRSDISSQLDIRDELGAWEMATVEPGLMLMQPGVYATPSLGKTNKEREAKGLPIGFAKSRGFSAKALDYQTIREAWERDGMAATLRIPETRFIGFGYALATNNLDIWRTWQAGEKVVRFGGTSTKSPSINVLFSDGFVPLVSPPAPAAISAPYERRERTRESRKEEELSSDAIDSQPDIGDNIFIWNPD